MGSHMIRYGPETLTSYANLMAQEFVIAFRDKQTDAANHEKLASFVCRYYVNRLNGPEFASALTNKLGNDPLLVEDCFYKLSCHFKEHLVMLTTLKSVDESLIKRIDSIHVSKKVSAVLFTLAAMAAAAVAAANANPKREAAGPAVAAAAAAASILFGAVGKGIHSLLNKRETAARKHNEITAAMIIGAKFGMGDLCSIHTVARRLEFENKSFSEKVDDGNKVAAVRKCLEEFLRAVEDYSDRTKWAKDVVLQSIISNT